MSGFKTDIISEACIQHQAMEIMKLKAQLAAITQDRDDLLQAHAICPECAKKIDEAAGIDLVGLNRQLAASQAENEALRKVLEEVKRHGIEAPHPWAKELAIEYVVEQFVSRDLTAPQLQRAMVDYSKEVAGSRKAAVAFLNRIGAPVKAAELQKKNEILLPPHALNYPQNIS